MTTTPPAAHDQTAMQWARERGVDYGLVRERLAAGWPPERALEAAPRARDSAITFEGQTLTLAQWATQLQMPYAALFNRVVIHEWPIERAFTEPLAHPRRRVVMLTHEGRTQSLTDWSFELQTPVPTLRKRLRSGWSVERTLTSRVSDHQKLP